MLASLTPVPPKDANHLDGLVQAPMRQESRPDSIASGQSGGYDELAWRLHDEPEYNEVGQWRLDRSGF